MAETKKRIIQYNEELTPALDDYLIMDSPTAGTRKILASNIGGGGGNANVTELTYAQYMALTPAERTDGTIYMVTDDPNDSGVNVPINYSTAEQDTGLKWVDGKKIYQKTFVPNLTLTTSWQPVVDMTDIDWITDIEYHSTRDGSQVNPLFSTYDFVTWAVRNGYIQFANNTTSASASTLVLKDVTIRYTKTTD